MTMAMRGGSAETETKAVTVMPCICSPALMVTRVTPAGKRHKVSRNAWELIGILGKLLLGVHIEQSEKLYWFVWLPITPHFVFGRKEQFPQMCAKSGFP